MTSSAALANEHAYDCWAPSYPPLPHNPLMRAEQQAVLELWPGVAGACALDLACGTGRYARLLAQRGAAFVVAADISLGMLRHAAIEHPVRADMMQLPFANDAFDLVVSGLAVGHAPQLEAWMREAARVLVPWGVLVLSDFHPDAAAAGMTRSFTDVLHRKHTLSHCHYDLPAHRRAAAAAGLEVEDTRELKVGRELNEAFDGSQAFYERWQGLAVVLVLRLRKMQACKAQAAAA